MINRIFLAIFIPILLWAVIFATITYASYQPIPQTSHFGFKKSSVVDLSANDIQQQILIELRLITKQLSLITGETLTEQDAIFY